MRNKGMSVNATRGKLVDRLRGIYRIPITDGLGAVGAGEEPNNPDEFVRHFETGPIQHEAATEIDRLISALEKIELMCLDAAGVEIEDIYGVVTDALKPDVVG